MGIWILRFLVFFTLLISSHFLNPFHNAFLSFLLSLLFAIFIILFEINIRKLHIKELIGALIGSAVGITCASLICFTVYLMEIPPHEKTFFQVFILTFMGYVGLIIGTNKGKQLELNFLEKIFSVKESKIYPKILDTSVIIDGRIADICETGFIEGKLIVPQFVLKELQLISDSSDSMKRNRGRRGLDILNKMQKMSNIEVIITEEDFPSIPEVDLKLIELALSIKGKIITNDFNLNKVAQLRGVKVLNINELANSLRPVVLPGETLKVFILKEGKEENQGVAYLDDGTMVVVDEARPLIGKTVLINVTSVLQTTAGKMIFGKVNKIVS